MRAGTDQVQRLVVVVITLPRKTAAEKRAQSKTNTGGICKQEQSEWQPQNRGKKKNGGKSKHLAKALASCVRVPNPIAKGIGRRKISEKCDFNGCFNIFLSKC